LSLTSGSRLGPYEVLAKLGEGGMGEVYRARDTKLGRDVALKILPDAFAGHPDRLMRFEREARTLASLNHPHIAQLYGLEDSTATRALAMELVDGEDLSARIARGPLPLDEALSIARQIAEALQAAHEIGVIHRDLKPGNVKVRADGTVKVLDFGLAKAMAGDLSASGSGEIANAATITSPALTMQGVVLGTAAYMAPEQARGRFVDKRADMWALGCVVYEMLTGRRAFNGSSPGDVIAEVVSAEPDWTALPPNLPAGVNRVVRRCLEKNPERRLRDAGDARLDLEDTHDAAARPARGSSRRLWMSAAAVVGVGAIALAAGVALGRRNIATVAAPVVRATIVLPPGQDFQSGRRAVAISRDGQQIVYSAQDGLYLRRLDSFESRLIPGTSNTINPAFSPDGGRIAVTSLQESKSIDLATGTATALRIPRSNMGGILGSLSWNEYGLIQTLGAGGVFLFPPGATDSSRIVELAPGEAASSAQMLPGGKHVLMTLLTLTPLRPGSATGQVLVQSLESGSRTPVVPNGSDARYVPSGHIVYAANGALYAVDFDVQTLRTIGSPLVVAEGVRATNIINATTHYGVSDNGVLVYVPGQRLPPALALDLVRVDRNGDVTHLHLPPAPYEAPRVSPDGRQVAISADDGTEANVWIHDLSSSGVRKLTVTGRNRFPVWSPDGRRLAYQSDREGDLAIFAQAADGSSPPSRLTTAEAGTIHTPESWSPNGSDLLFAVTKGGTNTLWRVSLASRHAEPFGNVVSPTLTSASFSPDGKWVAYNIVGADRSHATFVQPFPPTGGIYPISSNDDGHHPVWSRDGRELFYIPGPGRLIGVKVTGGSSFTFASPTSLPAAGLMGSGTFARNYDILKDGSGFIGRQIAEDEQSRLGAPPRIQIMLNWLGDLNRPRQPR
jgi:serine/threonine-protein kinase